MSESPEIVRWTLYGVSVAGHDSTQRAAKILHARIEALEAEDKRLHGRIDQLLRDYAPLVNPAPDPLPPCPVEGCGNGAIEGGRYFGCPEPGHPAVSTILVTPEERDDHWRCLVAGYRALHGTK